MAEEEKKRASKTDQTQTLPHEEMVEVISDVPLRVTVTVGELLYPVKKVVQFGRGSILELHKPVGEPVDIKINGKLVARGELLLVDEKLGVKITEIIRTDYLTA